MNIVSSKTIHPPKIKVSPPLWIMISFGLAWAAAFVLLMQLAITNIPVKYGIVGIFTLVTLGILRNMFKGNFLTTMQANKDGVYFQTDNTNQYLYVPWENVGQIEKAIFPLNKRGLRIEITGDDIDLVKTSKDIGNIKTENGRTYIYTIPQLRDRDELIKKLESLR